MFIRKVVLVLLLIVAAGSGEPATNMMISSSDADGGSGVSHRDGLLTDFEIDDAGYARSAHPGRVLRGQTACGAAKE